MRRASVTTKAFGVFAVCALAFAPLPTASAGCGDYLVMDHGPSAASHDAKPQPCNGPNCHRQDAPPLAPAPELHAPPPTLKAGALMNDTAPDSSSIISRLHDSNLHPLSGFGLSILRPPRSV